MQSTAPTQSVSSTAEELGKSLPPVASWNPFETDTFVPTQPTGQEDADDDPFANAPFGNHKPHSESNSSKNSHVQSTTKDNVESERVEKLIELAESSDF